MFLAVFFVTVLFSLPLETTSQRTLCPAGWTRFVEYCYQFIGNSDADSYKKAISKCQTLHESGDLSAVYEAPVHYHIVSLLKKNGANKTLIGLNDVEYPDYHLWHDSSTLNFTSWDKDIADPIQAGIEAGNTEQANCIEITVAGDWEPVVCDGRSQPDIVCQMPVVAGMVCNMNGERFDL